MTFRKAGLNKGPVKNTIVSLNDRPSNLPGHPNTFTHPICYLLNYATHDGIIVTVSIIVVLWFTLLNNAFGKLRIAK